MADDTNTTADAPETDDQSSEAPPESPEPTPKATEAPAESAPVRPAWTASRAVPTLLGVLVAIAAAAALRAASSVMVPLVLAVFLCYFISPVMDFLKRHRVPEALTLPSAMLLMLGVLFLLQLVVVQTIGELQAALPRYADRLEELFNGLVASLGERASMLQEVDWVTELSKTASSVLVDFFGSAINFVANLVLVLMYMIFIMLGRHSLMRNLLRAAPEDRADDLRDIVSKVNSQVRLYIITKILLSALTGFLMFAILAFWDVDFALFWGLIGFLFNFIPTVGSAVAALMPSLIALLQFDTPLKSLWVLLSLIVVHQIIGNGIEPAVQGERLNLSPIVILFALVFFGWLWGFWGMVLSVPLMASLKIVFEHTTSLKPVAIMMEKGKV